MLLDEIHHPGKLHTSTALRRKVEKEAIAVTPSDFIGGKISYRRATRSRLFNLFEKPVFILCPRLTIVPVTVRYNCLSREGPFNGRCRLSRTTRFKSDNVQPTFGYMQQRRISDSRDGNVPLTPLRRRIITTRNVRTRS